MISVIAGFEMDPRNFFETIHADTHLHDKGKKSFAAPDTKLIHNVPWKLILMLAWLNTSPVVSWFSWMDLLNVSWPEWATSEERDDL